MECFSQSFGAQYIIYYTLATSIKFGMNFQQHCFAPSEYKILQVYYLYFPKNIHYSSSLDLLLQCLFLLIDISIVSHRPSPLFPHPFQSSSPSPLRSPVSLTLSSDSFDSISMPLPPPGSPICLSMSLIFMFAHRFSVT